MTGRMKKINFVVPLGKQDLTSPSPVKEHVPKWYRDGETYDNKGAAGLKTCVPFLDVMLSGYVVTTIDDINVFKKDGVLYIEDGVLKDGVFEPYKKRVEHNHKIEESQIVSRFINERKSNSGSTIPRPAGHLKNHFVWQGKWGWKVPRGYSVLVTHPFNRFDLPFTTTSGIIDSDGWVTPGNIPFFLKEDFEGVILKNTPVAQIFPYKRESWKMGTNKILQSRNKTDSPDRSKIGYYKNKYWNRKTYN